MSNDKNSSVVAIVGPTGVGKTKVSVMLAKKINAKIVSADSMQVYKYMNIGTAKASNLEMNGICHYMLDFIEPREEYNVVKYVEQAKRVIEKIKLDGFVPLIVGGTGLYVDSLINGTDFSVTDTDEDYKNELLKICSEKGNIYLHEMLKNIDRESYDKIHPNNVKRVIRALEIYKVTGKTKTQSDVNSREKSNGYKSVKIGLTCDRDLLYKRIDDRVDKMIKDGLIDEIEDIIKNHGGFGTTAGQAIGYSEIIDYVENKTTYDEAINLLKRNSRRYAKRQFTWFLRDKGINWIKTDNLSVENIVSNCIDIIKNSEVNVL